MNAKTTDVLKISFAILLFICLVPTLPYSYFQLIRFIGLFFFAYLAYRSYQSENMTHAFIYLALAVLFQPLAKIALGRTLWNFVDIVVGVWLIYTVLKKRDSEPSA